MNATGGSTAWYIQGLLFPETSRCVEIGARIFNRPPFASYEKAQTVILRASKHARMVEVQRGKLCEGIGRS